LIAFRVFPEAGKKQPLARSNEYAIR